MKTQENVKKQSRIAITSAFSPHKKLVRAPMMEENLPVMLEKEVKYDTYENAKVDNICIEEKVRYTHF